MCDVVDEGDRRWNSGVDNLHMGAAGRPQPVRVATVQWRWTQSLHRFEGLHVPWWCKTMVVKNLRSVLKRRRRLFLPKFVKEEIERRIRRVLFSPNIAPDESLLKKYSARDVIKTPVVSAGP